MKNIKTILVSYFFLAFLISCTDDDPEKCVGTRTENVSEVNAPASAEIKELILIEVQFQVTNGCGNFDRFLESGSERFKTIEVQAKYEGCICPQVFKTITAVYEFDPPSPGAYELKFRSGENEFITVNILITD